MALPPRFIIGSHAYILILYNSLLWPMFAETYGSESRLSSVFLSFFFIVYKNKRKTLRLLSALQENQVNTVTGHGLDDRTLMKHSGFAINASSTEGQTISSTALSDASPNALVSMGKNSNLGGNLGENYLLDERALLASVARAIGPGGRTRISSTVS